MTIAEKEGNARATSSTKKRIERKAISIFSEKGYGAASVREIAEASGVTKPVVYYYFKSKDNLCHDLIHSGLEKFRRMLRDASAAGVEDAAGAEDALERLVAIVQLHFDFCSANVEFVRFLYSLNFGPDRKKISYDFHGYDAEVTGMLTDLLRRASEAGLIRKGKEDVAVRYMQGIIRAYVMYHFDGNDQFSPELARTIVTDMVNGLRP